MLSAGTTDRPTTVNDDPKFDSESAISEICVVDLGEHSRRSVKRLRRGEGRLMDKVEDAILSLREEGILDGTNVQTVVVVVREESSFGDFLNRDDDDDDDDGD